MDRLNEKAGAGKGSSREQPSELSYTSLQALRLKLGQILLDAGLLQPEELQQALKIAKESDSPVGAVLLTLGYVTDNILQNALLAQSLVAEGVTEQPAAIAALKHSAQFNTTLKTALERIEAARPFVDSSELDDLLLESQMVSQDTYKEAKQASRDNQIPLGRALVLKSGISFQNLNHALECVALLRNSKITKEEAVGILREIRRHNVGMPEAMKRMKVSPRNTLTGVKLGDILTAGKFINERDNLAAVERGLLEKRLLGDVLIECGLVTRPQVQCALTLQTFAARGVVSKSDAVRALRRVTDEARSFSSVAEEMRLFKDDPRTAEHVLNLLYKAGLARPEDVPTAMQQQKMHEMDALKSLVACGCISDVACQIANECYNLVQSEGLTEEQAVIALQMSDRNRSSLAETLSEMGLGHKQESAQASIVEDIPEDLDIPQTLTAKTLSKSVEGKLLIANIIVGVVLICFLVAFCPASVKLEAVCAVVVLISINQFALGKYWHDALDKRKNAKAERLAAAQQQLGRLGRKK